MGALGTVRATRSAALCVSSVFVIRGENNRDYAGHILHYRECTEITDGDRSSNGFGTMYNMMQ